MRLARWIFGIAAIWGIAVIAPLYFLERWIGEYFPPPIAHPETYYGFVGVTLAWQFLYGLIAYDPLRYRPVMLIGAAGKLSFATSSAALYLQGRVGMPVFGASLFDLALAILFVIAWWRTGKPNWAG
ncbi:hypothetical protein [Parasphingopyxis marina]|uniref:DoxX-like family protein n=1 Tax=Parasphingopyxis marina TaxID=2761622 RepID=A0A842I1Y2_9SPHN|nr:hypothetical protein [Parasphingopyxis marina]MBC2778723.1 hypothetical protein [Parasphingopyxis marina]